MADSKWKLLPRRHIIKKRQASRIEPVISSETEQKLAYGKYPYSTTKGKLDCVICGTKASHIAYFQVNGASLIEKYCQSCLARFVFLNSETQIV